MFQKIVFLLFLSSVGTVYSQVSQADSLALVDLFNSTNDSGWANSTNWLTENPVSEWYGVTVSGGSVTALDLKKNNLAGTIPASIGNLTQLTQIKLGNNKLTGGIPATIGNLIELTSLIIVNNNLTGTIPSEIGNCSKLITLFLSTNKISGSIPASIGNLAQLNGLFLRGNQLSGAIPPELGNLAGLTWFNLSSNQLSGTIPPALANLKQVQSFLLFDNQLSGTIPPELGSLTNVTALRLSSNQLSGSIPPALGNLANLTQLYLNTNQLSGSIPPELSNLNNVAQIYLNSNQLSGSIPSELGNLPNVTQLSLYVNQLSGTIPSQLGNLGSLTHLYLNANMLNGTIPSELGNLSNLAGLNLSSNNLTGTIPVEITNLGNLKSLALSNNQLSGTIPSQLGLSVNLIELYLDNNQFSGTIPNELGNLNLLTHLYLNGNQLSGSIPSELGNLQALTNLNLGSNQLSGAVPSTFTGLANITAIVLSNNQFTDLSDISSLTTLTSLNISNNHLTFEDIEPNVSINGFVYSPQDSVDTAEAVTIPEGNSIILSVSVGGTANQYQWMKDSIDIPGENSSSLPFNGILPADSGVYNCKVTNTLATELTIYGRPTVITVIPQGFIADSLALIDLYNAADGANWLDNTNWLTANALETWFGVTVEGRRVVSLDLSNNNLTDSLPGSLGNCTVLNHLDLSHNKISGEFPAEMNGVQTLQFIALNSNLLIGLPEVTAMTSFDTLYVQNNRLTFEDIEQYVVLSVFTYSPQDSIDTVKSMTLIEDDALLLSVSVGGSFNRYQWIKDGSDLSGETNDTLSITAVVPPDSGVFNCRITNTRATELTLYSRPTTVTVIPQGFFDDSLALIDLYTATDGKNWLAATNWLSINALSSWYGVTLKGRRLAQLDVSNNNLSGVVPASLGTCTALNHLDLSGNHLSGAVPSQLINLHSAESIALDSNQFDDIPKFSSIAALDTLRVQNNKLTFEAIEPNMPVSVFTYAPQDSIGEKKDTTLYIGDTLILTVSQGVNADTWQWMKNGSTIPGGVSNPFIIDSIHFSDSGSYLCVLANTNVPGLTLYTRPTHVLVEMPVHNKLDTDKPEQRTVFAIAQNPVNRNNDQVDFYYSIVGSGRVRLDIYDPLGNRIYSDNFYTTQRAGKIRKITWNMRTMGRKVACGTYLVVFSVCDTGRMHVIKKNLGVKCE